MGIDYAQNTNETGHAYNTNQEIIIIQLGLEKAFDHLDSSFLVQLIQKMGSVPVVKYHLFCGPSKWVSVTR